MAFGNIGLQEPSTITARVATVTIARGSTTEAQEILVLGDLSDSLAVARVVATDPASTAYGLSVRQVGYVAPSTTVTVSALPAGSTTVTVAAFPANSSQVEVRGMPAGSTSVTVSNLPVTLSTAAPATGDTGVVVRQVGYIAPSTTVTVAAFPANSSQVEVRALPANSSQVEVRAFPSALVTTSTSAIAGNSSGSALITKVVGQTFNSSNELLVAASFTGSTDVTSKQGTAAGPSSAWAVRLSDGSTWLTAGTDWVMGSTFSTISSVVTGPTMMMRGGAASSVNASDAWVAPWASTHGALHTIPTTDSGVTMVDSTNTALRVNVVAGAAGGSTIVTVSTVQGRVGVAPTDTNWASSAGFHFNSSGELNVNAAVTTSTTVNVSSLAGRVTTAPTDTNWASSAGFHFNSSGELNIAGSFSASTTVNVSSLAGRVTTAPTDTNWASSAGFHFNSSGELNIAGSFSASTTVNVSSLAGRVTTAPTDTNWASSAGFHFNSSGELNVNAAFSGSTQVTVSNLPATMSTSAPATGDTAVIVRQVGYVAPSTIVTVAAGNSSVIITSGNSSVIVTSGNSSVTVSAFYAGIISTASPVVGDTGLIVRPLPTGSSLPFPTRPSDGSTWVPYAHLAVKGSTVPGASTDLTGPAQMLRAGTHTPASTDVWTAAWGDSAGAMAVTHGRTLLSTFSTNLFVSSNFTFGSTTTGQSIKVYAYSITSTVTSAQEIKFYAGSSAVWALVLQAQSGGIAGANLSVTPPAFLFKADQGSSMSVNLASSLAGFKGGISYFVDPLP